MDDKSAHHYEAYHCIYTEEHRKDVECASTYKDPSLRAHLLTLSQASRRPCVRLWPVQPRVLRHYHDISDEPRDLCHSTTIHWRLIEFLLQRYYTYRSPASCICPDAQISLVRQASAKQHVPCYRLPTSKIGKSYGNGFSGI